MRLETKLAALDGIESDWRASQDSKSDGGYGQVTSGWLSYGSSYIGNIVENLQLNIKDIHLRYEDDSAGPGGAMTAIGIMIESLSAQTCDVDWSPRFVYRDPVLGQLDAFKLVDLTGLAVYIDTEATSYGNTRPGELWQTMRTQDRSDTQYVLAPVSGNPKYQMVKCHNTCLLLVQNILG